MSSRTVIDPATHHLVSYVALTHSTTPQLVLSGCRHPRVSMVRALCCWLLYHEYEFGLSEIGRALHLDHSSVDYAVRRVQRDAALYHDARDSMTQLRALATAALPAVREHTA